MILIILCRIYIDKLTFLILLPEKFEKFSFVTETYPRNNQKFIFRAIDDTQWGYLLAGSVTLIFNVTARKDVTGFQFYQGNVRLKNRRNQIKSIDCDVQLNVSLQDFPNFRCIQLYLKTLEARNFDFQNIHTFFNLIVI